jgi:hypothetical protein
LPCGSRPPSAQVAVWEEGHLLGIHAACGLGAAEPAAQLGRVARDAEALQAAAVEVELGGEKDPLAGIIGAAFFMLAVTSVASARTAGALTLLPDRGRLEFPPPQPL